MPLFISVGHPDKKPILVTVDGITAQLIKMDIEQARYIGMKLLNETYGR